MSKNLVSPLKWLNRVLLKVNPKLLLENLFQFLYGKLLQEKLFAESTDFTEAK